jgi:hypothetical protein
MTRVTIEAALVRQTKERRWLCCYISSCFVCGSSSLPCYFSKLAFLVSRCFGLPCKYLSRRLPYFRLHCKSATISTGTIPSRDASDMVQWTANLLTGLTSDTEPSLLVTFENAKYLFNVGENTTRSFLQTGRRWNNARGVFLTSVGTTRASGLPGKILSRRNIA